MRSSRARSAGSVPIGDQRGLGLVEILVASAILGVALSVMLGNLGTMVVGARVADRLTGEERLVRNRIEALMALPPPPYPTCPAPAPSQQVIGDALTYKTTYYVTVVEDCTTIPHYLEYTVTASDTAGGSGVHLSVGRYQP
jgi:prepilin-type N-terminal cleavage/methylation domain-containing protein